MAKVYHLRSVSFDVIEKDSSGSFAFLRVNRTSEKPAPELFAISRIHKMVDGKIVPTSLDD